ncbi:MAG: 3'-5' exonuclease [Aquificae bacterium]|nr:3'-5' exonuclease [Aquificota bacterium]
MRDDLLDGTFVVVDVETTGFDVERSEIIDIAAVRVEGGVITDKFSSLVYPGDFIPERIRRLTGITNAMLIGQPRMSEVLPRFLEFVKDDVVVGHFVEQDVRFIDKYTKLYYNKRFKNPTLCTLKLSRRLFPGLERYTLQSVARELGLSTDRAHRALKDALLTAEVFIRILNELWHALGRCDYTTLKRLEKGRL